MRNCNRKSPIWKSTSRHLLLRLSYCCQTLQFFSGNHCPSITKHSVLRRRTPRGLPKFEAANWKVDSQWSIRWVVTQKVIFTSRQHRWIWTRAFSRVFPSFQEAMSRERIGIQFRRKKWSSSWKKRLIGNRQQQIKLPTPKKPYLETTWQKITFKSEPVSLDRVVVSARLSYNNSFSELYIDLLTRGTVLLAQLSIKTCMRALYLLSKMCKVAGTT